ncbi:MAG: beta strand repeat-containing protein [Candidatus Bathyarchaeia archaeon]
MQSKKVLTTAITALLLLSMLAFAAPALAIDTPTFYKVGATSITGPVISGNVGDKILVNGTGSTAFGGVNVYWDAISAAALIGTTNANNAGVYAVNVTIPSAVNGVHYIVAQDALAGTTAPAQFTVVASLSAGRSPVRALPGDSITLTGHGFSANSAVTVTFGATTLTAPAITTNATGSFSAVITVPPSILPAQYGTYTVTATDASAVAASASVIVDYYVSVSPTSGPPGITLTISGRITAATSVTVNFGSAVAFTTTSDANGRFSGTYALTGPIILGTAYTITATFGPVGAQLTRTATFTVNTNAPVIALTIGGVPVTASVAGTVVVVTGQYFSGSANATLAFGTTVVNSTATDSRFGPTNNAGTFTAQFTVPSLTPGAYTVVVTDQYGAQATTVFTILAAPATTIALRGTTYARGDALSFNIFTTDTFTAGPTVTVRDGSGQIWWTTGAGIWPLTAAADGSKSVLYQDQLINGQHLQLPADAPTTGSWNWTVDYTPQSTATVTRATGLFTVAAGASLTAISTKLDSVASQIAGLNATLLAVNGQVVTLGTSIGTVQTSVSSLPSSISSSVSTAVSNGLATVTSSIGTITTSLSNLDTKLTGVSGNVATLSTSLGTVTTSLSNINPTLTSIQGDIATIKTDVGTLQGSITSVNNGVATIQTSVGTLQTSVSNLQTDVTNTNNNTAGLPPLLYVAIVFALIAALAAIACIILMRRKIAG